jgi:hypothetical protein
LPPSAPQAAPAGAAEEFFGGWILDRSESTLTAGPMDAETVVIVPWETSGWVWARLSGGAYQPEGVLKGVERMECGAASGPAAVACGGAPESMTLYWASWDGTPFSSYGENPAQVQLTRVDDRRFSLTAFAAGQDPENGERTSIVLSADGDQMIVSTEAGGNRAEKSIRVYDRLDGRSWPASEQ